MENKNVVAEFEKVSYEQFEKDWLDTFRDNDAVSKKLIVDIYNYIKKPKRATVGSAGYDIYSPIDITLQPGQSIKIPTGLKCKIEDGWWLGIMPRSGHGFKYGLRVINTVGVIDSDYIYSDNEGHIFIKLINDSSVGKMIKIPYGEAFAQGIFLPYGITKSDNVTTERNGGFGSTNK